MIKVSLVIILLVVLAGCAGHDHDCDYPDGVFVCDGHDDQKQFYDAQNYLWENPNSYAIIFSDGPFVLNENAVLYLEHMNITRTNFGAIMTNMYWEVNDAKRNSKP